MSYILKKEIEKENPFDTTEVEFRVDTVSLQELIEQFEAFLRACGFSFEGNLEIVEDETDDLED